MKYAFFQGCNIPVRIEQYASSTEAVLNLFDIQLEVMRDFNCCGYPMRNVDEKAYLLPSVRNLALAEQAGLDILVICNCCFQSLQKAQNVMASNQSLNDELNAMLAREGLRYSGSVTVNHYLAVLHEQVGIERIKSRLTNRYTELNIAVLHGCHLLRPREITRFDDSFVPAITENLTAVAGAKSVDWPGRLECCGAALAGINDPVAEMLLKEKVNGATGAGAEFITPICSYCHLQLDTAQLNLDNVQRESPLPVLLYPQLLGLCLGLSPETLGLRENQTISEEHIEHLVSLLGPPVEDKKKRRRKAKAAA